MIQGSESCDPFPVISIICPFPIGCHGRGQRQSLRSRRRTGRWIGDLPGRKVAISDLWDQITTGKISLALQKRCEGSGRASGAPLDHCRCTVVLFTLVQPVSTSDCEVTKFLHAQSVSNRRIFSRHRCRSGGRSSCNKEVSHKRAVFRDRTLGNWVGRRRDPTASVFTVSA